VAAAAAGDGEAKSVEEAEGAGVPDLLLQRAWRSRGHATKFNRFIKENQIIISKHLN